MSKILIIEDEVAIADLEKDYLELSDFKVDICNTGDEGLKTALAGDYDLIILDLMLPGMDGFEVCKKIREEKNIPILMVSAKKDDIDKIRGLGLGADDYMTKPFSPSELVARVKAHMARYERLVGTNQKQQNDIVEIRGIRIDKTARRVYVDGVEKTFTTKEFDLLTFLAEHPNHVFTKEELFREIWDMDSIGDIATVTEYKITELGITRTLALILPPSQCISRRSVRRSKKILQSLSISRPSGVWATDLKYKRRKIRSEENSYDGYSNKLSPIGVFYLKVCYNHSIADCTREI